MTIDTTRLSDCNTSLPTADPARVQWTFRYVLCPTWLMFGLCKFRDKQWKLVNVRVDHERHICELIWQRGSPYCLVMLAGASSSRDRDFQVYPLFSPLERVWLWWIGLWSKVEQVS